jgi:hypothetical protein
MQSERAPANRLPAESAPGLVADIRDRLLGLAIVVLIPTLFWTGVLAVATWTYGASVPGLSLTTLGVGVGIASHFVAALVTGIRLGND